MATHEQKLFLVVVAIQIVVTGLYALGMGSLKYSFIGDEYAMYTYAKDIATGVARPSIFSLNGVYGTNPVMGSYVQAFFMIVFGSSIYAWKFSSIMAIFPIGIFMFYLMRRISDSSAAFLSLVMIDSSYFFYNFFQIGYVNNQSVVCMMAIMYILARLRPDVSKKSYIHFFILGILTGLSWYFYIGKLFIFLVPLYLAIVYKANFRMYKYALWFAIPVIVLITPGFFFSATSEMGLSKTITHREFTETSQVAWNFIYPWYLSVYTPSQTHYLPKPSYVDPVTGILSLFGMVVIGASYIGVFKKTPGGFRRMFLFFILLTLGIGLTSPYAYPPATRGIHYVPFYVVFAICGLETLIRLRPLRKFRTLLYIATGSVVLMINVYEITQPLPVNATQRILEYIVQSSGNEFTLVENCGMNFYNIQVLVEGYALEKSVRIAKEDTKQRCYEGAYILSCGTIVCPYKSETQIDGGIVVYEL